MTQTLTAIALAASLASWGAADVGIDRYGEGGRDRMRLAKRGATAAEDARVIECAFSNPAHAGLCTETADASGSQTPEQACQPILDCLNDARCVKTYCGSTTVRSGWKLESAKPKGP